MPTLEAIVPPLLRSAGVPGCSVAVVDRAGLRWAGAYGLADVASGRPATPDDVYHLFSGTKLFTATAVMQLVERGELHLDAPVSTWIPELEQGRDVTLQQLLSHRSGLRDTLRGFLAVSLPGDAPPTTHRALAGYRIRSARPPGTRVEYRNVNYALLGEVITRVTGVEYDEHVTRSVLVPLGIRAGFAWTDALRRDAATGYLGRFDPMRIVLRVLFPDLPARLYRARIGRLVELGEYTLTTAAIGGLIGSMPELAKFLTAHLDDGRGILGEASTRRMQTLVAEGAAGIESRHGIALGWKIGRTPTHDFLNHEGGGAGFTSELRLYPHAALGIALAMNTMRMPTTMRVAHRICEAILEHRDTLGDARSRPAAPR